MCCSYLRDKFQDLARETQGDLPSFTFLNKVTMKDYGIIFMQIAKSCKKREKS